MSNQAQSGTTDPNRRLAIIAVVVTLISALIIVGVSIWGITQLRSAQSTASAAVALAQRAETSGQLNTTIITHDPALTAMLDQFRLATPQETATLVDQRNVKEYPAAAKHIYVATAASFTLTATSVPMMVVVTPGHRWASGQLGNTVLVRVQSTDTADLIKAGTYSDPLCDIKNLNFLWSDCLDPSMQTPATPSDMLSHLRHATFAELQKVFGAEAQPGNVTTYYVATSNFRVAPSYSLPKGTVVDGILIPEGIIVKGGQLGNISLFPYTNRDWAVSDNSCSAHGDSDTKNAQAVLYNPSSFASPAELQRVQRCAR